MNSRSSHLLPAVISSAVSLFSATLYAGTTSAGVPKTAAAEPAGGSDFGLTGDWGGYRSKLKEAGVDVTGAYTGEVFSVVKGGNSRGTVFDGLVKLGLDLNLEKLSGWQGATFRVTGLFPHGNSGTTKHAGDASEFSNISEYDTIRLNDFWLEQKLLEEKFSLRIGQLRLDDEFGVTDSAGIFVNSTYGVPSTVVNSMPYAKYPSGALGVRVRVEPIKGLYGQVGVYDGNPSAGDFTDPTTGVRAKASRHGTDWALRSSEGVLWAGEIGYQRTTEEYPGAIRLGFLHHTDGVASLAKAGKIESSNNTGYFVIDQTVWQKSGSPKEAVTAFVRGVRTQDECNEMKGGLQAGLTYSGLAKEGDKLGLAYAYNRMSRYSTVANADYEAITELTYAFPVSSSIQVQPDLQYIQHPGGSSALGNAVVIGVRFSLNF